MKPLIAGLATLAFAWTVLWLFFAYCSADLAWPMTALSWSDPDMRWIVPPSFCRFLIAGFILFVGFFAFAFGTTFGED